MIFRKILILFSILFISTLSYAQKDLIVTATGEQIRCKISDETATSFKYSYLSPSNKVLKNEIFKSLVTSFKYNYFKEDLLGMKENSHSSNAKKRNANFKTATVTPVVALHDSAKVDTVLTNKIESVLNDSIPGRDAKSDFKNFMRYRVGFKLGGGYMPFNTNAKTPYGSYLDKMKAGVVIGFDALYFFNDHVGLGFTYSDFKSQNSSSSLSYYNPLTAAAISGKISDNISCKLIAPTLALRKSINYKSFLVLSASPGVMLYQDKRQMDVGNINFKGNTFGAAGNLSYDILIGNDIIGRDIILSFEVGMVYGKLNNLTFASTGGTKSINSYLNMTRGDFCVALRFTRFPYNFR